MTNTLSCVIIDGYYENSTHFFYPLYTKKTVDKPAILVYNKQENMKKQKVGENDMAVVALTPDKIHHEISSKLSKGVPYIDALVDFAEKNNLEIETIAQIVKKSSILKEKIRTEAVGLRMVKQEEPNLDDIVKGC